MNRYQSLYMEPLDMNPEIRDMWVAALLSGAYKKGKEALHKRLTKGLRKGDGGDRWCCLGVLCDLAKKNGVKVTEREGNHWTYDGDSAYLPLSVQKWAGLRDRNPFVYGATLASHNDGEIGTKARAFETIAAMIAGTYKER